MVEAYPRNNEENGLTELAKARQAFDEDKLRRAADKGLAACFYLSEAVSQGSYELTDSFHEAALLTLVSSALYRSGYYELIDKHVLTDYEKIGVEPPVHALIQSREYAIKDILASDSVFRADIAIKHASIIEKFDPQLARDLKIKIAKVGINDFHLLTKEEQESELFQYYKEGYEKNIRGG